jgi:hypothetical protein
LFHELGVKIGVTHAVRKWLLPLDVNNLRLGRWRRIDETIYLREDLSLTFNLCPPEVIAMSLWAVGYFDWGVS